MKFGLVLLGGLLVVGFFSILDRRFAEGGLYPHFASYRPDPLGTSVFYEALESLGTVSVSRNTTHLMSVAGLDEDTVLLLLGYPRNGIEELRSPDSSPVMEAVKEKGARLVITLNPGLVPEIFQPEKSEIEDDWLERRRRLTESREPKSNGKGEGKAAGGGEEDSAREGRRELARKEKEEEFERLLNEMLGDPLVRRLSFEVTSPPYEKRPEEGWETGPGEGAFPDQALEWPVWKSPYRLKAKDEAWKTILRVGDEPVVLERSWGKGTVVVATDTFFACNENLHLGAEPGFLLWLLGEKSRVVFDETIHGTTETGGAMKLIRRYRAHGIFFGLFVFLALWAWRSASPLVSADEVSERGLLGGDGAVLGEETGTGFIRLLRRSVPSSELLQRCVEVWSATTPGAAAPGPREEVGRILERHRRDPREFGAVEAYRAVVERLRKR